MQCCAARATHVPHVLPLLTAHCTVRARGVCLQVSCSLLVCCHVTSKRQCREMFQPKLCVCVLTEGLSNLTPLPSVCVKHPGALVGELSTGHGCGAPPCNGSNQQTCPVLQSRLLECTVEYRACVPSGGDQVLLFTYQTCQAGWTVVSLPSHAQEWAFSFAAAKQPRM